MHNSDPEGLLMKRVFTSLRAFLVLFIVLYLLFLTSLVLPDRSFSESENKYLSPLPAISFRSILNGSFMEKYDNYVSDQFPVRDAWIRIKSLTESVLMKTENNGVVYGKDGYLFQRFTYDSKVLEENINAIDTLGSSSSVPVSVLIVPSSYTVLSDKLPDGVVLADQRSYLEHGESGPIGTLLPHCSVIDVLSVLERHNDEYIYYRTDHHWTALGAWYVERYDQDQQIVYAKNPNYVFADTKYAIPGVHVKIFTAAKDDETAAIKEFLAGHFDGAGIPQEYLDQ